MMAVDMVMGRNKQSVLRAVIVLGCFGVRDGSGTSVGKMAGREKFSAGTNEIVI